MTLPWFPRKTVASLQGLPTAATAAASFFPPEAEMDGLWDVAPCDSAPLHPERLYVETPRCEWFPGRIKVDDVNPKDDRRKWRRVWGINDARVWLSEKRWQTGEASLSNQSTADRRACSAPLRNDRALQP